MIFKGMIERLRLKKNHVPIVGKPQKVSIIVQLFIILRANSLELIGFVSKFKVKTNVQMQDKPLILFSQIFVVIYHLKGKVPIEFQYSQVAGSRSRNTLQLQLLGVKQMSMLMELRFCAATWAFTVSILCIYVLSPDQLLSSWGSVFSLSNLL